MLLIGYLHKKGGPQNDIMWRKRYFVLRQNILYYSVTTQDYDRGIINGQINLDGLSIKRFTDEGNLLSKMFSSDSYFNLETPNGQIYELHGTKEEVDNWAEVLAKSIACQQSFVQQKKDEDRKNAKYYQELTVALTQNLKTAEHKIDELESIVSKYKLLWRNNTGGDTNTIITSMEAEKKRGQIIDTPAMPPGWLPIELIAKLIDKTESMGLKKQLVLEAILDRFMQGKDINNMELIMSRVLELVEVTKKMDFSETTADICMVCYETKRSTVIVPCGHICLCYPCATNLQANALNCPICRGYVLNIIRVYHA